LRHFVLEEGIKITRVLQANEKKKSPKKTSTKKNRAKLRAKLQRKTKQYSYLILISSIT
jgi:hypothetical protein